MIKRYFLFVLPVLFLIAYITGISIPVPGFLLSEQEYHIDSDDDIEQILLQFQHKNPALGKLHLVLPFKPNREEIYLLQEFQETTSIPVSLEYSTREGQPVFLGYSYHFSPLQTVLPVTVLFSQRVDRYETAVITPDGDTSFEVAIGKLDADYSLPLSFTPSGGNVSFSIILTGGNLPDLYRSFTITVPSQEDPKVLKITERSNQRSIFDYLYSCRTITPGQLTEENLTNYPLVLFDGIPIRTFDQELSLLCETMLYGRLGSIFFSADSPEFGTRGDNPIIESILPAELASRTLKYLPAMGILIILDISASMGGEKLSLAKMSTLELIKNLKSTDKVGLLTFWDEFEYLYDFTQKQSIKEAKQLTPIIAKGGTDLYSAMKDGMARLGEVEMEQRHIIIFSDGQTEEADFESLIRNAAETDLTITTIGFGEEINRELLTMLAVRAGGKYYEVVSAEEIPSIIFEDRKDISRSYFAEETFPIFNIFGEEIAGISGMSLFTPKQHTIALYENQFRDPLFIFRRFGSEGSFMFLSDLYGYYTEDYWGEASVLETFRSVFNTIVQQEQLDIHLAEGYRTVSLTFSSKNLIEPVIRFYIGNKQITETICSPQLFNHFSGSATLTEAGEYTALLFDRGSVITRFPFFFHGTMEGEETDSVIAQLTYKERNYRFVSIGNFPLYLFFISSVLITFIMRKKR